jgi:hypothetical protein
MVWVPTPRPVVLILATYLYCPIIPSGAIAVCRITSFPINVVPSKNDTKPVGVWVAESGILTSTENSTGRPTPTVLVLKVVVVGIGGDLGVMVKVKVVDVLGAKNLSPL